MRRIHSICCSSLAKYYATCTICVTSLAFLADAAAQPSAGSDVSFYGSVSDTPAGLSVLWRSNRLTLGLEISSRSSHTFSANGKILGIRNAGGIRIIDTADGSALRWLAPNPVGEIVHSLAIASTGVIAAGRVGGIELYGSASDSRASRYRCIDACGPVTALVFSPDGSKLAYQGTRGLRERQQGLGAVVVLDARSGRLLAQLSAPAARAFVRFSPDGRSLIASNVALFDETETYGFRIWDSSTWQLTDQLRGRAQRWRGLGRLAATEFAAAYVRSGRLEVRDLKSDEMLWSVPLAAGAFNRDDFDDRESAELAPAELTLVEFAPNGHFVVTYELSGGRNSAGARDGTIVVRRSMDGAVEAMYEVADVTDLKIAPDSRSFVYSTRFQTNYTAMAAVPISGFQEYTQTAEVPD
jgi:WD40 repeat protein